MGWHHEPCKNTCVSLEARLQWTHTVHLRQALPEAERSCLVPAGQRTCRGVRKAGAYCVSQHGAQSSQTLCQQSVTGKVMPLSCMWNLSGHSDNPWLCTQGQRYLLVITGLQTSNHQLRVTRISEINPVSRSCSFKRDLHELTPYS